MSHTNPINQQNNNEALDALRKAEFTVLEIDRLCELRHHYGSSPLDQAALDYARLRFVRWLVETGRLTDQLPENDESSDQPQQITEADTASRLDETPLDHGAQEPLDQVTPKQTSSVSAEKMPILKMVAARLHMKRLQLWLPPPALVLYQFTIM